MTTPETLSLPDLKPFPNNRLPVLLYRQVIDANSDIPDREIEHLFERNGWSGAWRNGIFDYHHYHAQAHEVLGCARGWVTVQLGGPEGEIVDFRAGDIVVLPAGTSHRNLKHSDDYLILGSYPPGQTPDMKYGKTNEYHPALEEIPDVPLPKSDPVTGISGGLLEAWG